MEHSQGLVNFMSNEEYRPAWTGFYATTSPGIIPQGEKYDNAKLRLDLLPFDALMEVGEVYSLGASKYADRNWEKGINYMRIVGALLRHLFSWICGEERAQDDKQRHLASVVWCGLALLTYELRGMKEFDDRNTCKENK